MIRINLLPYRAARKKENIRYQVNVYIGSLILVLLAVFWYNSSLNGSIESLNKDIRDTQEQVAKYKKINKEIADIKAKLKVLEKKIEVIESLEEDRKVPVQNMDALYTLLVEKRMWYTQITEKDRTIHIKGVAIDNQTVADYMTRVEKSDRFANVRLATISKYTLKGKENLSLKQFDVNFRTKPSPKKAAGTEKK